MEKAMSPSVPQPRGTKSKRHLGKVGRNTGKRAGRIEENGVQEEAQCQVHLTPHAASVVALVLLPQPDLPRLLRREVCDSTLNIEDVTTLMQ